MTLRYCKHLRTASTAAVVPVSLVDRAAGAQNAIVATADVVAVRRLDHNGITTGVPVRGVARVGLAVLNSVCGVGHVVPDADAVALSTVASVSVGLRVRLLNSKSTRDPAVNASSSRELEAEFLTLLVCCRARRSSATLDRLLLSGKRDRKSVV